MIETNLTAFNVAQLLKEPIGSTRVYDVVALLDSDEAAVAQVEPLLGKVRMLRTNRGILVESTLTGEVIVPCSRCLTSIQVPVTLDVEEEFQPTIDVVRGTYLKFEEEDSALLINDQHILDLEEVLRQALLLALPMQVLCRQDCGGLCPICGRDRNVESCDCDTAEIDARWQDLSVLLSELDTQ
ncbi:MAG: DUF177 domain-containing protein [Chloroflexota bacterium]|nr:DUF177 domain-containing protein [Chloroflexota bacterium]